MKSIIIKFIILTYQCFIISCMSINIKKNGFYHIHVKSNTHDILTVNDIKYREGIFYKKLDIILYLRQGQYNISTLYNGAINQSSKEPICFIFIKVADELS